MDTPQPAGAVSTEGPVASQLAKMNLGNEVSHFGIREHQFQKIIHDVRVCVQVIVMNGSYMFWVGTASGSFGNLDISMKTQMDSIPVSSTLLSTESDITGSALATRLATKLGAQVFVSYNLSTSESMLLAELEQFLIKEIIPSIAATSKGNAPA